MDPTTLAVLASNAVAILAPHLEKAAGEIVPKAAADLYEALKKRFAGKPAAQEALTDLEQAPKDEDVQASLRNQLKKALVEDEAFAAELERLVRQAMPEGPGARVSASGRGVAAGGDISGNVITGDIEGGVKLE